MDAPEAYRLSFLVGGLLAQESSIAAPIYLSLRDWKAVRSKLDRENLLHARTQASAARTGRELVPRMETLTDDEVAYLVTAPGPDRKHLMWVAFCRRYAFVAEFAEEVLRDKVLLGTMSITPEDFDRFWAAKSLWHSELDRMKPSTRRKLRNNLYLATRQAGFVTEDGLIVPPLLTPEITRFLNTAQPSELRFFPIGGTQ